MNKLRTIYLKNHETFNNSKPKVQFYWFLLKNSAVIKPISSKFLMKLNTLDSSAVNIRKINQNIEPLKP